MVGVEIHLAASLAAVNQATKSAPPVITAGVSHFNELSYSDCWLEAKLFRRVFHAREGIHKLTSGASLTCMLAQLPVYVLFLLLLIL